MKKNINLKSGILSYSLLCLFFFSQVIRGEPRNNIYLNTSRLISNTEPAGHKPEFELQFFSNGFPERLNFDILKQLGIEKVIIRVFEDKLENGGLYFSNSVFRVIHPTLDLLIPAFKGKNVSLYAWMITRNFKWVKTEDYFDYEYSQGFRKRVRRFDIFNPQAIEKIITVYRELASKKIAGILIQDDFFIRYNEGLSNWGKAVFAKSAKHPADEKSMLEEDSQDNRLWINIKVNQIIKVLNMIVSACKGKNPDLKIGMNLYYESPIYNKKSEIWYAHDLGQIAKSGLDFIYLMTYHRQIKKEMKLTENQNQELFKNIVNRAFQICKNKLVVKLQLRDWDTGKVIPIKEMLNYLRLIPPGVQRICLTPVKLKDFDLIKRMLNCFYHPSGVIFKN